MTLWIDPRLERRRRQVREQTARISLRKLMWVICGSSLGAIALWFVQSPLLAVDRLVVHGADPSRVGSILEENGVALGRPLLMIRPGRLEEALLEDPWIAEARVSLVIPDTVEIELVEREASGWVMAPSPVLIASDGVVLTDRGAPTEGDHIIDVAAGPSRVGEVHPDPRVRGGIEFLNAIGKSVEGRITLTVVEGELWARMSGIDVRLGRPVAMEAKAAALVATLREDIEEGSTIVLLAPTRPAIIPPPTSP